MVVKSEYLQKFNLDLQPSNNSLSLKRIEAGIDPHQVNNFEIASWF
jgi:hypothetical protein